MEQFVEDDELIHQYQAGEESAIAELHERHKKRVFSYILNVVRDRNVAQDIFQETFFKVIRSLKKRQYNGEGKFIHWVIRIAHNLIFNHFLLNRKMWTISKITRSDGKVIDIFEVVKIEDHSLEDSIFNHQIRKDVRKLINHLPHEQMEVVILRHYYDMSFKEIADMTNVSISTSLGRMRYALINLRRLADEYQIVLTK
jgi:RNA polymerase sigma factor (sigma-70 family)